jgi:hypothetical protein
MSRKKWRRSEDVSEGERIREREGKKDLGERDDPFSWLIYPMLVYASSWLLLLPPVYSLQISLCHLLFLV